ncbi:hypothetical protein H312_02119 [Anncaliia algerae PRA339]|uniref:Amino acid transporter transmembrane domain-containing protein n=1 Tax=Anncaliia algerae PRA339 TaxID=1288291 RepID=A0A059F048_9MICR|nr:hypothetical protein H312_02119 [Anncaliia algerae PRA339]
MTEKPGKLSVLKGSFIIMNTMFGAGVVGIPNGFMAMGYFGGSALLAIAVIITILTLIFLCLAVEKTQIKNFAELSGKMGRGFAIFLDLIIILLCYGSTLCYFLLLVKNTSNAFFENPGWKQRIIVSSVFSVPLFFLSKMKSLDKLSFTSMLTVFATFFVGVSLVVWNFTNRSSYGKLAKPFSKEIMRGYPSLLFALGCQQNGVAVYSSLKNRNTRNGALTMVIGSALAFLLYILIGVFGYLVFGDLKTYPDSPQPGNFFDIITKKQSQFMKDMANTFDSKGYLAYCLNFAFGCVLFSAFPLQTLSGRSALQNLFFKNGLSEYLLWLITFIHLAIVYIIAVLNLDPGKVIDFIGTTACPMISFFFPSAIYLYFFRKKGFMYFSACLIGLLSFVAVALGLYDQIKTNIFKNLK